MELEDIIGFLLIVMLICIVILTSINENDTESKMRVELIKKGNYEIYEKCYELDNLYYCQEEE